VLVYQPHMMAHTRALRYSGVTSCIAGDEVHADIEEWKIWQKSQGWSDRWIRIIIRFRQRRTYNFL